MSSGTGRSGHKREGYRPVLTGAARAVVQRRMPLYRAKMGFGLHYGWAIEGAIGSNLKIDASYLSPDVNMATAPNPPPPPSTHTHTTHAHWQAVLSFGHSSSGKRNAEIDCLRFRLSQWPSCAKHACARRRDCTAALLRSTAADAQPGPNRKHPMCCAAGSTAGGGDQAVRRADPYDGHLCRYLLREGLPAPAPPHRMQCTAYSLRRTTCRSAQHATCRWRS